MTFGRVVVARDTAGGAVELWSEMPVVEELPHLLWPDEVVKFVFTGSIPRALRPRSRRWLIVLTDQRVLCLKRRMASTAPRVREVHYEALTGVTTHARILMATVVLTTGVGSLKLRVSRTDAHRIVQAINSLRRGQMPVFITTAPTGVALPSSDQRYAPEQVQRLESTVEQLEADVARMQRQLEFLEQLLQTRASAGELPPG